MCGHHNFFYDFTQSENGQAVPEAWFPSTVVKDAVEIIKMIYDISAKVYGTILVPYFGTKQYVRKRSIPYWIRKDKQVKIESSLMTK